MKSKPFGHKLHFLYAIVDVAVVFLLTFLSFYIYYKDGVVNEYLTITMIYCGSLSLVTVLLFFVTGIYKILTKDIGIFEMVRIFFTSIGIQFIGFLVLAFVPQLPDAFGYLFISFFSSITISISLCGLRVITRLFNLLSAMRRKKEKVRTLVIGAGASGKIVVDESRRNKDNRNLVIAFVDDDVNKIGGTFANLPVKGPISKISTIIDFYEIQEVIIAINELTQERLHEILMILDGCPVRVRRLPIIQEMQGPNDTRIIDVDLNDLLSRDPIILDNHEVTDMLNGKTVLITGAGGSIGSELTRQIFNTHPARLIIFDIYENNAYDIQMELVRKMREENIKDIELLALIGSTYDDVRMEQIFKKYRPDYVYHAAAYKHVPLMEDSPAEAIRTNVLGTYNVARLADKYKATKMVLVSTDKAVRPTNVMGATKRFAETIIYC